MTEETNVTEAEAATEAATEAVPEKNGKRKTRTRKSTLVVGMWEGDVFTSLPAELQPRDKAAREIRSLRAWLKRQETATRLGEFTDQRIDVVRQEPAWARYTATTTRTAKIG
jgi:hypothetical protein